LGFVGEFGGEVLNGFSRADIDRRPAPDEFAGRRSNDRLPIGELQRIWSMKLQNRNLSIGAQGDDVKLLHAELRELGFGVDSDELDKRLFGKSTLAAVKAFQKAGGLPQTGVVDEKTPTEINRLHEKLVPAPSGPGNPRDPTAPGGGGDDKPGNPGKPVGNKEPFVVHGRVVRANGAPGAGVTVRAFDQDVPSLKRDELLG